MSFSSRVKEELTTISRKDFTLKRKTSKMSTKGLIRDAFLRSGSISDPEKFYHLEIVFTSEEEAKAIQKMLEDFKLDGKIAMRKGHYVVYLKEGRVAHPGGYMDKFTGELQLDFTFKPDFDGDGIYGETEEGEDALNITKGQIFSPMTNADFIEAMIPVGDLIGWIDEGIDYKFTTLGINFQNYQHGSNEVHTNHHRCHQPRQTN